MNTVADKFKFDAVVMAGGQGERMNLRRSKVLLRVDDMTLLEHSIVQLRDAGINRLFILCDNAMYDECTELAKLVSCIYLYQQKKEKYDSTFLILKEFIANHPISSKFLFAYGHVPRHFRHYISMLKVNGGVVASQLLYSTRRDIIEGQNGTFIEPPYAICNELINLSSASRWSEFFDENRKETVAIDLLDAPNEFNSYYEYEIYSEYIRNNYHPLRVVGNAIGLHQSFVGFPMQPAASKTLG